MEVKSVAQLAPIHTAQMLTYLRLTDCPVGLLNFNVEYLHEGLKRVVNRFEDGCSPRSRAGTGAATGVAGRSTRSALKSDADQSSQLIVDVLRKIRRVLRRLTIARSDVKTSVSARLARPAVKN